MSYIGQQPVVGRYILLDQISGGFNGTATGFTMAAGGQGVLPGLAQNVLLSLGGVIQQPGVDYLISGSGLTFTTAPVAGTTFFATVLGDMQAVGTPSDGTVLPASIASSGTFVFPNVTTTGTTLIASGTAGAPSLAVIGDVNTGLYSPGADQLSIATNGTERLRLDSTGQLEAVSLGSAAAPTYSWTTDPDTGVYSPGANQVAISTNGTGRLFVDASGRIGIGQSAISSPLDDLHISSAEPGFILEETDAGTDEKRWRIRAEGSILRFEGVNDAFNATTAWLNVTRTTGARTVDNIAFSTGTTERMRLDSSGRLGLGTSSPQRLLTLTSDGSIHQIAFNDSDLGASGAWWLTGNVNGVYKITQSTNAVGSLTSLEDRLVIDSSGRVGIGTTTPAGRLHLSDGSSGQATVNSFANTLVVEDNASNGISILTPSTTTGSIFFGDEADNFVGGIRYDHTDNSFQLYANDSERARIDSSGRLLVGKSTATGAAIFQVQTPTTLSTTNDEGVEFTNTSAKVYPTTANFGVTAGLSQNIELSTAQVIDTVTPGGFNFVYGIQNVLTKSAGNTQDIERLYFNGFNQTFTWADANTCKQYLSFTDIFNYSGYNANSRTSSSFAANTVSLNAPDTRTQTIANITSNSLRVAPAGTSTVAITSWASQSPGLLLLSASTGTKTCTLTDAVFYDTSTIWGTSVTTGTLAATITNLFGLRLRPPASTTGLTITNNWGLYQEWSLAKNWFAGASNQYPNITTTASGANAFLDSANSNRLYRSTSSLTYKRDVEDLDSNLADQILNLRPVWYRSKCDSDCQDWSWYGLIAEEVAEIDPRFVHYGYQEDAYEFIDVTETVELPLSDPRRKEGIETEEITRQERQLKADAQQVPNGVAYERLVVPLLDIIKRQKSQLELIEARLAALEAR